MRSAPPSEGKGRFGYPSNRPDHQGYCLDIHSLQSSKVNLLERIQFIFTQSRHNLSVRLCLIAIQRQPVHITFISNSTIPSGCRGYQISVKMKIADPKRQMRAVQPWKGWAVPHLMLMQESLFLIWKTGVARSHRATPFKPSYHPAQGAFCPVRTLAPRFKHSLPIRISIVLDLESARRLSQIGNPYWHK